MCIKKFNYVFFIKDLIAHGQLIATNYEIAKNTGTLANPNYIQPDFEYLNAAISTAKEAVTKNTKEYSTVE